MMKILYKKKDIQFRYITKADLEPLRLMHNHSSTLSMLTDTTEVTPEMQNNWFNQLYSSSKSGRYSIYAKMAVGKHKTQYQLIGMVRIDQIDKLNKNMLVGLDIDPQFRGLGLGKKSFHVLMDYGFKKLKMHKLTLYTAAYNQIAISMYKSLGFKKEGSLKDHLRRGSKYYDLLVMSCFKK